MALSVPPPVSPMLAKASAALPDGDGWSFEPKYDGFRCIVFRDGDDVELGSRNEKPLTRYFPELVEDLRRELPSQCVLDGEIVIAGPNGLEFDALSQRIHPAEKRIRQLAESTPGIRAVGLDVTDPVSVAALAASLAAARHPCPAAETARPGIPRFAARDTASRSFLARSAPHGGKSQRPTKGIL